MKFDKGFTKNNRQIPIVRCAAGDAKAVHNRGELRLPCCLLAWIAYLLVVQYRLSLQDCTDVLQSER